MQSERNASIFLSAPSNGPVYEWQSAPRGVGESADASGHEVGARGSEHTRALRTLRTPTGGQEHTVLVAGGGYDQNIYLWDRASGRLRQTFHGHTNCVYALAFHPAPAGGSPQGAKLLASGGGNDTVRLWALPEGQYGQGRVAEESLSGQPVAVLRADLDVVHDLAFRPDGRILARGGSDRLLRLWNMTQDDFPELVDERKPV
jgi:WD40 repeat protein